jgi:ABC-2 type transport system permease protein
MTIAAEPATARYPTEPAGKVAASLTFARRGLLKIWHVPEQLTDAIFIPVLFTVMFTYVFGGAVAGSTSDYLHFLLPGTLVMSVLLITIFAGSNINTDKTRGNLDRFKSMPIWRPAVVVGGLISDVGRNLLAALIVLSLGLIMGFRPDGGAVGVGLAVATILVFAFGLSWLWSFVGLIVRSPNSVAMAGFIVQFPLVFFSNVFVDPETLPGWLQAFVDVNPVSHLVTTVRGLIHGTADVGDISLVFIATGALVAVFGPLTMRAYSRA